MSAPTMLDSFLADILAHPDDPAPWPILADWLTEHDDPRGELVRLTWQLQYEPDHPESATREARVQTLLAEGMVPLRPRQTWAGIEFVWIAPGTFLMGSPENEAEHRGNEKLHRVTLTRGFWLGVSPITQEQWRTVTGENPSYPARTGLGSQIVRSTRGEEYDRLPVDIATGSDAATFCALVTARLGRSCRLPTEAEWEYACRAGTTSPFHFGAILDGRQANCDGTRPLGTDVKGPWRQQLTVPGAFPPNAWGLYDMHGNVWERCQDGYREDYENLPSTDPGAEPVTGGQPVLRGGSADSVAWNCRSAFRLAHDWAIGGGLGLRVVLAA